jgi:hypothetical protein
LKNKEEMTRADCFLSLSGAILNFVAMSEKSEITLTLRVLHPGQGYRKLITCRKFNHSKGDDGFCKEKIFSQ